MGKRTKKIIGGTGLMLLMLWGAGFTQGGIHPSYDIVDLLPENFRPLGIGGIDFLPDGRMVIAEFGHTNVQDGSGKVWIIGGHEENDPAKLTSTMITEGLEESLGIRVVDGEIYVIDDNALIHLVESGGSYTHDTIATGWPRSTGNNWVMGLEHLDGTLNFSIGSWNVSNHDVRGCWVQSQIETNDPHNNYECMAGGLRSANALAMGPQGVLFTTDNQGNWNPSNRLLQLVPGSNYGFKTNVGNPFFDEAVALSTAYVPHVDAANSLSDPVFIKEGIYAGQMFIGDITQSGIKRYYLERVDGLYQSAVFRFCDGVLGDIQNGINTTQDALHAGVNRLRFGPDGALYVGGLGAGGKTTDLGGPGGWAGNWSWEGTWTGLQKLIYKGEPTFEMLAIRSVSAGFEVEFTKPVGASAENPNAYSLETWHNTPVEEYGLGAGEEQHDVTVNGVTVSADRMKVILAVNLNDYLPDGSWEQQASTLHLTLNGVTSQGGEESWTPEAWYFFNYAGPADVVGCMDANDANFNAAAVYDDGIRCAGLTGVHKPKISVSAAYGEIGIRKNRIEFKIPTAGAWNVEVLDMAGKLVKKAQGTEQGTYTLKGNFSNGIYFARLTTNKNTLTKRITLY